jgi:hypothetical protein
VRSYRPKRFDRGSFQRAPKEADKEGKSKRVVYGTMKGMAAITKTAMGKIAEFDGLSIYINTPDERGHPPHVHVLSADGAVEILLEPEAPIRETQQRGENTSRRGSSGVFNERSRSGSL